MATAYRRSYRDPDGQKLRCRTYTIEVKVGDRVERLSGFRDRKASEELGRRIERLANLRAGGEEPDAKLSRWIEGLPNQLRDRLAGLGLLTGRAAAATRQLSEHLDDYRQALLDGVASRRQKGPATTKHAELVHHRVETLLQGIGAKFVADVTPEAVGRWLADHRAKDMSVQTSNHYVTNAKSFCNWLVRAKRATDNPLASIGRQQVTPKARKHVRRPLEHNEAAALLRATRASSTHNGMTAEQRYWLYRVALETALRAGELRTLTPESFQLDGTEPSVYLPGDDTKNRQDAELPLRLDTTAELRRFLNDSSKTGPVFPLPHNASVARMLRQDLAIARAAWLKESATDNERADRERDSFCAEHDDAGRTLDFHALRVTALSWLADAGASVAALQEFARHSDPKLTMNVYTRALRGSQSKLVAMLPTLSEDRPDRQTAKRTGTYNVPADSKTSPVSTGVSTGVFTSHSGTSTVNSMHDKETPEQDADATVAHTISVGKQSDCDAQSRTEMKRRGRDSNPRNLAVQRFSRPPPSATRPPLLRTRWGHRRTSRLWHSRSATQGAIMPL